MIQQPTQAVQRFETLQDLDKHNTTVEEREEYEQHILNGVVVYAGVVSAAAGFSGAIHCHLHQAVLPLGATHIHTYTCVCAEVCVYRHAVA